EQTRTPRLANSEIIVFAICRVEGATSCKETTIKSIAEATVATSGRNSVAAIVLIREFSAPKQLCSKQKVPSRNDGFSTVGCCSVRCPQRRFPGRDYFRDRCAETAHATALL